MDKDFVLEMANTIKDQLVGMTPLNVIRSWSIENFVTTEYKGMAALRFHVNGRLFRGNVIIAYNDMDYYEVYLQNYAGTERSARKCIFANLAVSLMKPSSEARMKSSTNGFFGRNVYLERTAYDNKSNKNIHDPIHRGYP